MQTNPPRPRWLPAQLFPFQSHFASIHGNRVHYVDEGTGPVLLMLHGNPTYSFLYRNLIRGLKGRYRCIAVDYPGFGLSTAAPGYDFKPASHAKVIEQFVLQLGLDDATLMIHDWAGPIGLWVAERHPERFRSLVIGNTWAWPVDDDRSIVRFAKLMGGPIGGLLIRYFNAFVNLLIPAGTRRHRVPTDVMEAYRGPFAQSESRAPMHILPGELLKSRPFLAEVEAGLSRIGNLPALIVWGDADVAFREKQRRRFERSFPNHRVISLHGAGHFIQEDAPAEMVGAVLEWTTTLVAEAKIAAMHREQVTVQPGV
jgi:haloalkane dehalogenase